MPKYHTKKYCVNGKQAPIRTFGLYQTNEIEKRDGAVQQQQQQIQQQQKQEEMLNAYLSCFLFTSTAQTWKKKQFKFKTDLKSI